MSEDYWSKEYLQMLRKQVADAIEEAGEKAGQLKAHFDRYFEKGIVGYAFAITGRKRLIEIAENPDAMFGIQRGGAWIYHPRDSSFPDFEIACMYDDGTISGQDRRKRTSKSPQLTIFSDSEAEEDDHRSDHTPLVCVAYDAEFQVSDVILGELIRGKEQRSNSYDFVHQVSLKTSRQPDILPSSLKDVEDIELHEIAVRYRSAEEQKSKDKKGKG